MIGNYSFLGWYDGEDLISEELKCEYEMPTNDINIIVKFADLRLTIKSGEGGKKSGYYVTYDLNYEDAEAGEVIFVEEGMQVPYKTVYRSAESGVQYDFMYWCLDAEGTKIFDEDTPIREDMTIYAKWFNNTVVNYADILKPSSAVSTRTSNIKPGTYGSTYYYFATKDTTITFNYMSTSSGGFKLELTNMTQNKTLANWYHNPSGVDDYHAMNIQVKKGDILKFDFKRGKGYGCYARFYLDNLPLTPTGLGVVLGYDNEMVQSGTKITVSAEPIMYEEEYDKDTYYYNVKENGYTFIGWYDGDTLVSTDHVFTFIMPKKSVTYEPKYVKSTVVVEKDLKIASVSVGKCYVGEKTTIEAKPEYGHTFLGWFDKNNNLLTRELKLDVDVTLTETTYVAKYSSRYTIQTNADSQQVFGNVGVDPTFTQKTAIVPTVGTKVTLYASPYKNTFLGWYRNDEFYSLDTTIEVVATDEIVSYNALFRMNVYVYVDNDSSIYGWGSAEIIGDMLYVGDKVKLKATPSDNCEFTGWYLDGNLVSEDPEIEVEVTTDIQRFYAHFERKTS